MYRYEGTGRSLSLKLIEGLRQQSTSVSGMCLYRSGSHTSDHTHYYSPTGRILREVSLSEPIRYASGDVVEGWLYSLLCLDATNVKRTVTGCPAPRDCELYPSVLIYVVSL